jgi:hypothetical protein
MMIPMLQLHASPVRQVYSRLLAAHPAPLVLLVDFLLPLLCAHNAQLASFQAADPRSVHGARLAVLTQTKTHRLSAQSAAMAPMLTVELPSVLRVRKARWTTILTRQPHAFGVSRADIGSAMLMCPK